MLRKLMAILAKTAAAVTIALGLSFGFAQYTHPDLCGRSTEGLRWEVITLNRDHIDQPILVRLPLIERQEQISDELARRTRDQIRVWQSKETAAEDQGLASASSVQTH